MQLNRISLKYYITKNRLFLILLVIKLLFKLTKTNQENSNKTNKQNNEYLVRNNLATFDGQLYLYHTRISNYHYAKIDILASSGNRQFSHIWFTCCDIFFCGQSAVCYLLKCPRKRYNFYRAGLFGTIYERNKNHVYCLSVPQQGLDASSL